MPGTLPVELRALADSQNGLVSIAQLHTFGLTADVAAARVRTRRWQRVLPRVYATFTGPLDANARTWAALLYAGEGAVLSHESAAFAWGLVDVPPPNVDVTIGVDRRLASMGWVRIRYAHRLDQSRHPTKIPPATRVEDTVLDLVDSANKPAEALAWVTRACQRRRTTPELLALALDERKKIRWRQVVQGALADVADGAESPLEIAYVRRVESPHGLPRGRRQRHRHVGARSQWVDVEYEEFALIVELDGRIGHVEDGAFRDRRRDNVSTVRRRSTLRYGWGEVHEEPCAVAAEVSYVLARNGWSGQPRPCGSSCTLRRAA